MALQTAHTFGGVLLDEEDAKFQATPLYKRAQGVRAERGYEMAALRNEEHKLPLIDRLFDSGIKNGLQNVRRLRRDEAEQSRMLAATRSALQEAESELAGLLDSLPAKGDKA